MEVRWTEHAYRDLQGIHDHILLDSASVARDVVEIITIFHAARQFPSRLPGDAG